MSLTKKKKSFKIFGKLSGTSTRFDLTVKRTEKFRTLITD